MTWYLEVYSITWILVIQFFRSVPVKCISGTTCLMSLSSCMNRRCTHQGSHCRCVGRKQLTIQLLWWSLKEPVRTSAQRFISASQQQVHMKYSTRNEHGKGSLLCLLFNCLVHTRLTWHHLIIFYCRSAAIQSHWFFSVASSGPRNGEQPLSWLPCNWRPNGWPIHSRTLCW